MKKFIKNFTIFIFFLLMFYSVFSFFFKFHLVSDAYRAISSDVSYIENLKMVEGRPLQAVYFKMIDSITKNMDTINKYMIIYRTGLVISGVILAIAFTLIYRNIEKIINTKNNLNRILIFMLVTCVFINITICEYMLYIENVVMALGVLFAVLAVLIFDMRKKGIVKFISCYIFLVLSAFCYQGTTQLFVILSVLNFILRNIKTIDKNNTEIEKKEYVIVLIKIFGIYFAAQGVSYIICVWYNKLYPTLDPRLITGVVKNLKSLVSYNLVNVYKIYFLVFSFIIFYNIITPEDKNTKSNFKNMTILLVTSFASFIIFIFNNSAALVPRSIYNLIVIIPILELYIINLEYKKLAKFNIWIIGLFFIGNILLVIYLQNLNVISTKQNIDAVNEIIYRINEYEKTNNIIVEEIAFYKDESPNYEYWYAILNFVSTYTNPVYYGYWSDIYSINVLSNRKFRKIPKENLDENLTFYFKNKNWDKLNLDEQIIFEGNRVSICKF